jgi:hypothetical protein
MASFMVHNFVTYITSNEWRVKIYFKYELEGRRLFQDVIPP